MSSPIVLLPRAWLDLVDSELLPGKSATSAVDSVSPIIVRLETLVESAATELQLTTGHIARACNGGGFRGGFGGGARGGMAQRRVAPTNPDGTPVKC
jgi:hypothetical protein